MSDGNEGRKKGRKSSKKDWQAHRRAAGYMYWKETKYDHYVAQQEPVIKGLDLICPQSCEITTKGQSIFLAVNFHSS